MPLYDYLCECCGPFDAMRRLAEREQAACPQCGSMAPMAWLQAPRLTALSTQQRQAHETNERARHEPRSSREQGSYGRLRHAAGCACCSGASSARTGAQRGRGARMFPGRRPWMIGH